MLSELLSHLGQQETVFFLVLLSITVIMIAQYVFKDSGEFGERSTSDLSANEVRQIVQQAVRDEVDPLRRRIEDLEKQQSRQLSTGESPHFLADAPAAAPSDDPA